MISTHKRRRFSTKDSGRGEYAARMNASVSPRSGHPSEPAGSRAPPAVPLAVTCLLIPDEDQTRGMKRRTMTAARSSAAVTEPTDAGQEQPPLMMGHIARVPDGGLVVLIVDRHSVLQLARGVTSMKPCGNYRRVLLMEGA